MYNSCPVTCHLLNKHGLNARRQCYGVLLAASVTGYFEPVHGTIKSVFWQVILDLSENCKSQHKNLPAGRWGKWASVSTKCIKCWIKFWNLKCKKNVCMSMDMNPNEHLKTSTETVGSRHPSNLRKWSCCCCCCFFCLFTQVSRTSWEMHIKKSVSN